MINLQSGNFSTQSLPFCVCGMSVETYNTVHIESSDKVTYKNKIYDGFYVSYNNYDTAEYGSDTTALVLGQMQVFLILDGNHVENYKALEGQPFDKYIEYFLENKDKINKYSTTV